MSGSSCVVSWKFFTDACAQRVLRTFDKCPGCGEARAHTKTSEPVSQITLTNQTGTAQRMDLRDSLVEVQDEGTHLFIPLWRPQFEGCKSLQVSLCTYTWDILGYCSRSMGPLSPRTCCGTGGCGLRCSPGTMCNMTDSTQNDKS